MKHLTFYVGIGLLLVLSIPGFGQKTYDEYKKELKPLSGSKYISTAFDGAKVLAGKGQYSKSLDLMNRAVKKSRSMGSTAQAVVYANKAELLADGFPKEDKYVKGILDSYDQMIKRDPPHSMIEKAMTRCTAIRLRVSDKMRSNIDKRLATFQSILDTKEQELIAANKESELKEFKKLDKEEAFEEMEKLKTERERLETLQVKLALAVDHSEEQLTRRSQIISSMTRDKAKKEAVIQYNKRIIDSLRFISQLDSINLISNERLINEQESQLELQQSQLELQESELQLKNSQQQLFLALAGIGLLVAGFVTWLFILAKKNNKKLAQKNIEIEEEKERSEELLLNILPKYIAQELKEHSKVATRTINQCTVVFTDFINFSSISQVLTPQELISALDECFSAFDNIVSEYNIEKIKTIGDAYMCAGGVPVTNKTHAIDAVNAAFAMVKFLEEWNARREKEGKVRFDARIGIHSGPIIAGVVGAKKFAYDIWGDTVNVAARIEGQSAAQRINVSASTYRLIKDHYSCIKRGSISVKNMKDMEMYYVDKLIDKAILN